MTSVIPFTWLVHSALASGVLLLCGAGAVAVCRQPVDRLRLIQWSLVAALVSLLLVAFPLFPVITLGLLESHEVPLIASDTPPAADVSLAPPTNSALPSFEPIKADAYENRNDLAAPATQTAHMPARSNSMQTGTGRLDYRILAVRLVWIAYLAGIAVLLLRWTIGRIRLIRLFRHAIDVPPDIRAEFSRIAGPGSKRVLLLASGDVQTPIMWGLWRPVIVLPNSVLIDRDLKELHYYLAHEWAHVCHRDYGTWQLATLLQFFLYYQPIFWWLRRRLAISMDQLADAVAADQASSATDYAEFLVQLARRHLAMAPQLTLGINDRHSPLRQRVLFLLNAASRPRATCSRPRSFAICSLAILLVALVSAVRLDARPEDSPASPKNEIESPQDRAPTQTNDQNAEGSITYDGRATDAATGKGIPGVKVSVIRKLSRDPKTGGWRTLETTEHETDAAGRYSFIIPPEQAAEASLYLEVEARHPNYASKGRSGYSHTMIRKNLELGEQPFYSTIKLWPGEAITGKVVSPDGTPLEDVEISMYSATKLSKEFLRGSFDKTKTDANGVFRIVPPSPGDGVLWIKPEQYSPQAHRIADRRGDWGTLTMHQGVTLVGKVLDVDGNPVAGVKIEARRRGDGEKPDEFLNSNAVANQIGREAISGPAGEFTLASLPDGDYSLQVQPNSDSYDPPPLEQVFLRQSITIAGGAPPDPLEIRAVPHVVIKATYLDSAGKPRSGHELTLFGRMNGGFYAERSSTPGNDGKLEVKAPHGLQQVQLDIHTNEHSSLRWRMSPDAPLQRSSGIKLGTVEDDISGIEIIRYTAPILLVKPVDEQGAPVDGCTPVVKYTNNSSADEELTVYTTGSHVGFENQQDGRWRSSQALPDELMDVTVEKTGYTTTAQKVTLKEGEERELVFVMTTQPSQEAGSDQGRSPGITGRLVPAPGGEEN